MKKIDPTATPGSTPRNLRVTRIAISAIGTKVYFVSSPAATAAETVATSSFSRAFTSASETPRTIQSTSDQPAVSARAGVATIATVMIGQSLVLRSRTTTTA